MQSKIPSSYLALVDGSPLFLVLGAASRSLHPEDWRPHPIRASSEPGMWHPASRETWPIDASTEFSTAGSEPLVVGARLPALSRAAGNGLEAFGLSLMTIAAGL